MFMSEINKTHEKGFLGWLRDMAEKHGFGNNIREFIMWVRCTLGNYQIIDGHL